MIAPKTLASVMGLLLSCGCAGEARRMPVPLEPSLHDAACKLQRIPPGLDRDRLTAGVARRLAREVDDRLSIEVIAAAEVAAAAGEDAARELVFLRVSRWNATRVCHHIGHVVDVMTATPVGVQPERAEIRDRGGALSRLEVHDRPADCKSRGRELRVQVLAFRRAETTPVSLVLPVDYIDIIDIYPYPTDSCRVTARAIVELGPPDHFGDDLAARFRLVSIASFIR